MLLRNITYEADRLDDSELLDLIVTDIHRLRRCGGLLLAGFEGVEVVRARSYGARWYTHAISPEQARANIDYGDEGINVFEYANEGRNLPAVGVFRREKMKEVFKDCKLTQRYLDQFKQEPPLPNFYGVSGASLDEAALAVYYFQTPLSRSSH